MTQTVTSAHPTIRKLFQQRKVAITTMHGKELIMRPLIKQYLNLPCDTVASLDTDEFGTFSGEIERPFDPITTLRKKIMKGLRISGETLGIGNEGSFGPHPHLPFVHADQEIVMLIDLENDIEIFESVISTETNHAQKEIRNERDLIDFAEQVNFPSHGIILKQVQGGKVINTRKAIVKWETLYAVASQFRADDSMVIAESDMRAYLNPTRMKIIERATEQLMKKIISTCPSCHWPGFSCVEIKPGLQCKACGVPTQLPLVKVYRCKNCNYTDDRYYTEGVKADPKYCDVCNP